MRTISYKGMNIIKLYGAEGPMHDPYAYSDYNFTFKRSQGKEVKVKLHFGLSDYLKVDDKDVTRKYLNNKKFCSDNDLYKSIQKYFNKHFHISLSDFFDQIEGETYHKSIDTCQECGSNNLEWKSGYPGESFLVCKKCDHIVESEFDPSACM